MIRIRQIKIPIEKDTKEELIYQISKKIKEPKSKIKTFQIIKKSLDARKKPNIYYNYEIDISIENEQSILKRHKFNKDIILSTKEIYKFPNLGNKKSEERPIIIGSGPAGLFCAYLLAEHGFHPIIIERGEPVEKRVKTVEAFWKTGILNPESNVQFGEGGAGTFSDGKLNTLIKNQTNRMNKVYEIFVENGANPEILYQKDPHIGTDVLRNVVKNIRNKIIKMGGEFHYNTCLTNIEIQNNHLKSIEFNHHQKQKATILVLAIGHSARDTFQMLFEKGLSLESKPFAIGVRIQHSQEQINQNQYGKNLSLKLPPASYKLTYQTTTKRGVYSFCMCPGGYVVNASSEPNHLAINGMSNARRDTKNANSAIVVTVSPKDYGKSPLAGLDYQRSLEEKAYKLGNGKIPIQLLKDFHNNVETKSLKDIEPIFKGAYKFVNLNNLLPKDIASSIKEALPNFDKKIKGFNDGNAILAGIESRTSSPIRILRNEQYESNIKGIFPCGEGSGYAGGITTSAIDGIKIAESIALKLTNR